MWPVSSSCEAHVFGARGLGFDSWVDQIGAVSPTDHHRCDVSCCAAQALSRGDGPRHSLQASTQYGEYSEDMILIFFVALTLCADLNVFLLFMAL